MEFLKHEGIEPLKLLLDKSKMYKDVILYNISWGNGPWNEFERKFSIRSNVSCIEVFSKLLESCGKESLMSISIRNLVFHLSTYCWKDVNP